MLHQLVGVASEERHHVSSMHTKRLVGGAPHTYVCIQISEVEKHFTIIVENQ